MQLYLKEIINSGENQRIEFKTNFGKEVIETIVAFTNTQGGIILIGVQDDGNITGTNINYEVLKDWGNIIKQATQPQLFPQLNIIEKDDKKLVEVKIQEYPVKPVSFKGRYFKRVGAANHILPIEEIVELQLQSLNTSFDAVTVDYTFNDLSDDLIENFFREIKDTGRIKLTGNLLQSLNKLGFIRQNKITLASLLLFGNHNTAIHIGRFKFPDVIIDDVLIKSPLTLAVDEAMDFIKKNIRLGFDFGNELKRKEKWQFPIPAIREMLLNSIVHRDYRNPTDVIIKIFDNKIVFTNPGKFMPGLTVEDIKTDNYIAVHRNKLLAEAFYLKGDIEKYDTGFIRIRQQLKEYNNLKVEIIELGDFVQALIEEKIQDTTQDTTQDTMQDNNLIMNLLKILSGEMRREEMQKLLNIKNREYFRKEYIKPALELDLIEMTLPGKPNSKNQKYRLTKKGLEFKRNLLKNK